MRALCWNGVNDLRVETVPDPSIVNPHDAILRVRIIAGEGPVELGVHLDHLGAHAAQGLGHEGAGRAVATGGHDPDRPGEFRPGGDLCQIAVGKALDRNPAPARALDPSALERQGLEPRHFLRAEGEGRMRAHLDPGPAVLVVAGRDHGDARHAQGLAGEIGHGGQAEADVVNLGPAGDQTPDQGRLHVFRIAAIVMAGDEARRKRRANRSGDVRWRLTKL